MMKTGGMSFFSLGGGGLLVLCLFLPLLDGCGKELSSLDLVVREMAFPRNLFFLYPSAVGAGVILSFVLFLRKGLFSTLMLWAVSLALVASTYVVVVGTTMELWQNPEIVSPMREIFAVGLIGFPVVAANIGLMKFWKRRSSLLIIGACHQVTAVGLIAALCFLLYAVSQDSRLAPRIGLWLEFAGAGFLFLGASLQMRE